MWVEAHQRPRNPIVGENLTKSRHRRSVAGLGLAIRQGRDGEETDAKGLGELLPSPRRTRIVLQKGIVHKSMRGRSVFAGGVGSWGATRSCQASALGPQARNV